MDMQAALDIITEAVAPEIPRVTWLGVKTSEGIVMAIETIGIRGCEVDVLNVDRIVDILTS